MEQASPFLLHATMKMGVKENSDEAKRGIEIDSVTPGPLICSILAIYYDDNMPKKYNKFAIVGSLFCQILIKC